MLPLDYSSTHVVSATPATVLSPISAHIWDAKYRLKRSDGSVLDYTVEDTWRRVARALADPEGAHQLNWADKFERTLQDFKFLPGGRIVAGSGTGRSVTLSNCFVMGTIEDSMDGIFSHLREAALTMQAGGGIGYDFSTLRPKGTLVRGVDSDASGPLSFMDVWDSMCSTIMSAGERRGAMMGVLSCDHPDIEAFIEVKRDPSKLRRFNLSILVTDAFMRAINLDEDWNLVWQGRVHKTLKARELWDKIMRATYAFAEPGVIFIDRTNERHNLKYCEHIRATNPCGELGMPPYSSCLLGSVNLAALIDSPFMPSATIDQGVLFALTSTATRMMDNVNDVTRFPLDKQRDEAFAKRRVGLGITGLADALAMCHVRYGSDEAIALTTQWLTTIRNATYTASAQLAAEKGRFTAWDVAFLDSPNVRELPDDIFALVAKHGVRNGHLTAIAPTGTISLLAGNISSGLEPVFSLVPYTRRLRQADGSFAECVVEDWAVAKWHELHGQGTALPSSFVDVNDLTPTDHVRMMGAAQGLVDAAISKTVNVPKDIPFEEFKGVYKLAYELGCKSCTTYRPNDITGSVLEAGTTNNSNNTTTHTEEADNDDDIKGDFCHVDPITGRHDCG